MYDEENFIIQDALKRHLRLFWVKNKVIILQYNLQNTIIILF